MMDWLNIGIVRCIGCGCDDFYACANSAGEPCAWIAAHYDLGIGVCSECECCVESFLERVHDCGVTDVLQYDG